MPLGHTNKGVGNLEVKGRWMKLFFWV